MKVHYSVLTPRLIAKGFDASRENTIAPATLSPSRPDVFFSGTSKKRRTKDEASRIHALLTRLTALELQVRLMQKQNTKLQTAPAHLRPEIAAKIKAGSVLVKIPQSQTEGFAFGAGFIVLDKTRKPFILTNAHVLEQGHTLVPGSTTCIIQLSSGQEFEARLKAFNSPSVFDVAALEIPNPSPGVLKVLRKNAVKMQDISQKEEILHEGQFVVAMGHPRQKPFVFTHGIVGKLYKNGGKDLAGTCFFPGPVIQTDAPTAKGSSGGPLCDSLGRVIGMNFGGHGHEASWAIPTLLIKGLMARWGIPMMTKDEQAVFKPGPFNNLTTKLENQVERRQALLASVLDRIFPRHDLPDLLTALHKSPSQLLNEMNWEFIRVLREQRVDSDEPVTPEKHRTLWQPVRLLLQQIAVNSGFEMEFDPVDEETIPVASETEAPPVILKTHPAA